MLSILFALLFPAIGVVVACVGFCDPDTCWHLALGKWMFAHHSLPYVDPFSSNVHDFVFVKSGSPLMQHEWLSDCMFYGTYTLTGARGLLAVTALISCFSLAILPWFLMRRNRVPNTVAMAFILLSCCASAFRLWVRPEAISFLCMSALVLLNDICLRSTSKKTVGLCIAAVAALMALWTNCHALFVVGVAYLGGFSALSLASRRLVKRSMGLFGAALLSTLCTPWGFALWPYIMRLLQSPISHANKENGPMKLAELTNPISWPLIGVICLFLILELSALIAKGLQADSGQAGSLRSAAKPLSFELPTFDSKLAIDWESLAIGLTGAVVAVIFRRLTPLALLVVMAAVAMLYQKSFERSRERLPIASRDWSMAKMIGGSCASVVACVIASYVLAAPVIPSPSHLFVPPYLALEFLQQHPPAGRVLNDSKFGSMMTWTCQNPPDIFVDGRFDSFDRELVNDYNKMRLCRDNWRDLLDRYHIGWVFFPPDTPIIKALMETPGWTVKYADASAVVLQR